MVGDSCQLVTDLEYQEKFANCIELSPTQQCLRCARGYYLDNTCWKISKVIENCLVYEKEGCKECRQNFYLDQKSCWKVEQNFKIDHCLRYFKEAGQIFCSACEFSFVTSLDKKKCVQVATNNCQVYSYTDCQVCSNCPNCKFVYSKNAFFQHVRDIRQQTLQKMLQIQFSLNAVIYSFPMCVAVDKNCFSNEGNSCLQCKEDFYLDVESQQCVQNPSVVIENCELSHDNICTKCFQNYLLVGGACIEPTSSIQLIFNCIDYETDYSCKKCSPNYFLSNDKKDCLLQDIEFCNKYINEKVNNINSLICEECQEGYFLSNDQCQIIILENCSKINQLNNECLKCKQGYFLNQLKECQAQKKIDNCEQYSVMEEGVCIKGMKNIMVLKSMEVCEKIINQRELFQEQILSYLIEPGCLDINKAEKQCQLCRAQNVLLQTQYITQCISRDSISNPNSFQYCSFISFVNGQYQCLECDEGFYLDSQNNCVFGCSQNKVLHYVIGTGILKKCVEEENSCAEGYRYLSSFFCYRCKSGYEKQDLLINHYQMSLPTQDFFGPQEEILINYYCRKVVRKILNCEIYLGELCQVCSFGYQLSNDFSSCVQKISCEKSLKSNIFDHLGGICECQIGYSFIEVQFTSDNYKQVSNWKIKNRICENPQEGSLVTNCEFHYKLVNYEGEAPIIYYKCGGCKPKFFPVYTDIFISECKSIENCEHSLTLNKCEQCVNGFHLVYQQITTSFSGTVQLCSDKVFENCLIIDNQGQCILCRDNFYMMNGVCTQFYKDVQLKNCQNQGFVKQFPVKINDITLDFFLATQINLKKGCIKCSQGYLKYIHDQRIFSCANTTQEISHCQSYFYDFSNQMKCLKCSNGFEMIQPNKCVQGLQKQEIEYCLSYDSSNKCTKCQTKYQLINISDQLQKCIFISENIYSSYFDQNTFKISECKFTYSKQEKTQYQVISLPFISKCQKYDYLYDKRFISDGCQVCSGNYFLQNKYTCTVHKNVLNCEQYNLIEDNCEKCFEGYFLDINKTECLKETYQSSNCAAYKTQDSCLQCIHGYQKTIYEAENFFFNIYSLICEESIAQNCRTNLNKLQCDSCPRGFFLSENLDQINCKENTDPNCIFFEKEFLEKKQNQYRSGHCEYCKANLIPNNSFSRGECQSLEKSQLVRYCSKMEIINNNILCQQCQKNFTLQNNQCYCHQGYIQYDQCLLFESERDVCEAYVLKNNLETPVCSICQLNYVLVEEDNELKCRKCDDLGFNFCMICNINEKKCEICRIGYFMDKDGHCQRNTYQDN